MGDLPTGTVTFLFTDLEGSTRLWEEHPEAMQPALARHDEILRDAITAHHGHIVKTTGDGFHAAFANATEALFAARDAQLALDAHSWESTGPLRVRMGIHTCHADVRDGDYYGSAVNRAARLMSIANGGQILLSLATEELVREGLSEGESLLHLGEHRLRDLTHAERVFQLCTPGLSSGFPSLRSLDAFPGNLPRQLTSFVGRDEEVASVTKALARSALVTLTGVGGVGKTRLAIQVAAELAPEYGDGVWLCELAAAGDPEAMLQVVASTLGVSPRTGMSLGASIAEFLRARELLVVLDNCEHLLDATAQLVGEILRQAPKVRILATSREGLAVEGERVMPLRSLPLPAPSSGGLEEIAATDAVRLFGERAEAARPGFAVEAGNAAAVVDICRRLDGMPLAIELAAARVASMSPAEVAKRLGERFRLLTGGRRTAVERHHTLRATVDWSYSLLSSTEQRVFDRLGVFAGGFDSTAAESVVADDAIEAWDVVDALSSLVTKSMVTADETTYGTTRYELLETLRVYAHERIDEAGAADEYRHRHAQYYAEFAERAGRGLIGPDEFTWRRRFRADLANLRAAVTWAIDTPGEGEAAVRIVAGVAPESLNDRTAGVGSWAEKARAVAAESTPGRQSAVLAAAGWQAFDLGDYETQRAVALEAVRAGPVAACPVPSFAYSVLSSAEVFLGRSEQAQKSLDEAARAPEFADDRFGRIQLLATAAIVDAGRDAYAVARPKATEAVRLARDLENPTALAISLGVFGWSSLRDDPSAATKAFEEAIALTRAGSGDVVFATSLALIAPLRARARDFDGALRAAREAFTHADDIGDLAAIATALASAVEVLHTAGYPDTAAVFAGMLDSEAFGPLLVRNDPYFIDRQRTLAAVRATLGEEGYESAVTRGAAMSYDAGLDYSLGELDRIREVGNV